MKRAILLLLFISLVSASQVWQFSTDGEILAKPVIYQGSVVVASDDGNLYALSPMTGAKKWQITIGETPNEVFIFDNALVASTTSGKVVKVGSNGKALWTVDLSTFGENALDTDFYVYGASTNQKNIYVSVNNGIYSITKTGNVSRIVTFADSTDLTLTAPAAETDYVIYGRGNELISITGSGTTKWKKALEQGSFWLSRPVIDGGVVYIGALDNSIHAYAASSGGEIWEFRTKNWILSTPIIEDGNVYFGCNDGNVYAVSKSSGSEEWRAKTQLAVQTEPASGYMGGEEVIFVGGSDKNIYAISKDTGDIVWKGSAGAAVGSPLYYQNFVIAGSQDEKVYAYSTERACSITNPLEGDIVGLKELVLTGKYVSEAGGASVWVSINGGGWQETNTSNVSWVLYLDPSENLNPGLNTIACVVSDAGGQEAGPDYTTVAINHDNSIALSDFVVNVPPSIIEGEEFTIYINDGDDGSPVERFSWSINGQSGTSDNEITLTLAQAGSYQATIKKIGFNDRTVEINVSTSGVSPLYLAGGILVILIILWQVWVRFLSQRFKKK